MFCKRKSKSVLHTLRDRELNNACSPYFLSVNVVSRILRSDTELYKNCWKLTSKRPISYDSGYLYFNDNTSCYTIYGKNCEPSPLFKLQKSRALKKISDIISYSIPIYKTLNVCKCSQMCVCVSQYLLSVSEDNWLCQHSMTTGKLYRQFYVNQYGQNFNFKYCDWDIYGERFVLTSTLNYKKRRSVFTNSKSDVVVNIAVFHTVPFDFFMLFEIKRSVFGEACTAANLTDQHMVIGLGNMQVNIYSFLDFINQGSLNPYKLGDAFEDGKVGYFPTGLPLNFNYSEAPPPLFKVQCFGQIIRFGGYPYHCITADIKNSNIFTVTSLEANNPANDITLESSGFNDDVDSLMFHPDHSNRLLFKDSSIIHCFDLTYRNGTTQLNKVFSMGFEEPVVNETFVSSYGRRIKSKVVTQPGYECSIFCTDYASDFDLIAIMGAQAGDADAPGFIKLYDSFTGEEIRKLKLIEKVNDYNFYQLFVDMGSIILIERKDKLVFTVYVYNM